MLSVLPFPAAGVEDSGRGAGVDATLPPFFPSVLVETGGSEDERLESFPPFFPPVLVETGSSDDEMEVFFPPFPSFPVEEGAGGEVEESTTEGETDEAGFATEEDKTSVEEGGTAEEAFLPPSVTVM